jgi:hypothetical protein
MINNKGEIIYDTFSGEGVSYVHGSGSLFTYLEKELEGVNQGNKKSFSIKMNKQLYSFDVIVDEVRWATEYEMSTGRPGAKSCGCEGEC